MPDLGERANVMGPQPLEPRTPVPAAMLEAAHQVLKLLAEERFAELAAITTSAAQSELQQAIEAMPEDRFQRFEIVATARVNYHHYVKARLYGDAGQAFTLQMRLGERDGRWMLWEVLNLTGRRGAWTR